jgi:hypothetical protein
MERGARPEQVEVVTSLEAIAARVADWRGAVFVKGSRRYALEKVLGAAVEVHA